MLSRVCDVARAAVASIPETRIIVATDDERIAEHAASLNIEAIITPADCPTGSDRVLAAVNQLPQEQQPTFVINLQGDAPLTPPHFITTLLETLQADKDIEIVTPVVRLSWKALDELRHHKKTTPFTGTTAIIDRHHHARWFSKNILPAIRDESALRTQGDPSPVYRHIGIYGYRLDVLRAFVQYPESPYERLEQLEQLRALENGHQIRTVLVEYGDYPAFTGIDSPEDAKRAERLLQALNLGINA